MGTSMSDPIIAQKRRLYLKARALSSQAKDRQHASLKGVRFQSLKQLNRPLSVSRKTEFLQEKKNEISKNQLENTPTFENQYSQNYLQSSILFKKLNKTEEKQKENYKKNQDRISEDNYFLLQERQNSKFTEQIKARIPEDKNDEQLKLSLNSKIKIKKEELHYSFCPTFTSDAIKEEEKVVKGESKSNQKINNLLFKMIKQDQKKNRLLDKYLPKSKKQHKGAVSVLTSLETPQKRINLESGQNSGTLKYRKDQGKMFQKYYLNWKKKETSRKKLVQASVRPVFKKKQQLYYYELNNPHSLIIKKEEELLDSPEYTRLSELGKRRKKGSNIKSELSNHNQKNSTNSIGSYKSERRPKIIYF